ncbi:NIF3-like protein 1 [Teleopsis dalmanni]|uniref:NIF3-like protein 1 n=1 Tax=Teleopsis dalmanni TaxID=139649 RepID=UPI0018CD76B3|nr:NIF3-like protein 1 [Teleopsis dalmanni]
MQSQEDHLNLSPNAMGHHIWSNRLPNPCQPDYGAGRIFDTNVTLEQAISCVRNHIGTDVHLSLGLEHNKATTIKKVAVCAGSGASLLKGVEADLYVTGEMSHHELLDANHKKTSVILCNHSNSERGFLQVFKEQFNKILNNECEIFVSQKDKDPLITVK